MNKEPEKTLDSVMTLYLSNQRQIDKSVLLDMFDGVGLLSFLISHHDIKTTRHEINELIFKKINGSKEFYNLMFEDIEPLELPKISSKMENELKNLLFRIKIRYKLDSLESAFNLLDANWKACDSLKPLTEADYDFLDDDRIIVYGILTDRPKDKKDSDE